MSGSEHRRILCKIGAKRERTLLEVLDVAARERDADFVDLGGGHGGTGRVVFLFTLSDVTHPETCWRVRR